MHQILHMHQFEFNGLPMSSESRYWFLLQLLWTCGANTDSGRTKTVFYVRKRKSCVGMGFSDDQVG